MTSAAQRKIDDERDGMSVLRLVLRHQTTGDGIRWTREVLEDNLTVQDERLSNALVWLMRMGYLRYKDGEYQYTFEGDQAYREACASGRFSAFWPGDGYKTELLEGVNEQGRLTRLKYKEHRLANGRASVSRSSRSPVLPSSSAHNSSQYNDPADLMIIAGLAEQLARENNISVDEAIQARRDGRMKLCTACGQWRLHHVDNNRKDGAQSQCIFCRKRGRGRR